MTIADPANEIIAVVVGAAIGFVGTLFTSTFVLKKQRKLEAASKFREAFVDEVARCKRSGDFRIKNIVVEAMPKHEKAVLLFEPFLSKDERKRLRRHWRKYCELNDYSGLNDFVPETGIGKEGCIRQLSETEQRINTLLHLNKIINFAKIE